MKLAIQFLLLGSVLMTAACASYRPILDENRKYRKVGETRAEKDVDMCLAKADKYLEKHKKDRMGREVGRRAVGGAVVGGLIGALTGKGPGGAVGGAVGGAALGAGIGASSAYADEVTKDGSKPDAVKQTYVNNCLKRQSYEVIGWK